MLDGRVGRRTAYTHGRADVDLEGGFVGNLVAALHFNGPIDGANEGEAVMCVGGRAVGAVEVGQSDLGGSHCVCGCVGGWVDVVLFLSRCD
jgi:hypothetical protein